MVVSICIMSIVDILCREKIKGKKNLGDLEDFLIKFVFFIWLYFGCICEI